MSETNFEIGRRCYREGRAMSELWNMVSKPTSQAVDDAISGFIDARNEQNAKNERSARTRDHAEFAALQSYLTDNYRDFRPKDGGGLAAWALAALIQRK